MIHGLIIVNKKKDTSSFQIVQILKKILNVKKAGHFGTLDPMAEGLLLVGLGNATKFFDFYLKKKKTYSGRIKFGYATTTYDREGDPIGVSKEIDLNHCNISRILQPFIGEIEQLPPVFSAKKIRGRPAYKYARENVPVELKTARVHVYSLTARVLDSTTLWFRAETSSGTYIRSLVHDIGQKVGSGAYLDQLVREKIGEIGLQDAVDIEKIEECVNPDELLKYISPIESMLQEFPKIVVGAEGRRLVQNGVSITKKQISKIFPADSKENFRLFDERGRLLAIAKIGGKPHSFKPYIVFPENS